MAMEIKQMNEPVAWMGKDYDGLKTDLYFDVERNKLPYRLYETATPLYTPPVSQYQSITNTKIEPTVVSYTHPVKELTDEEILEIADANEWHKDEFAIKFARAILRKASEK